MPPDVRIACIFFDGEVPRSESDEYVAIMNDGGRGQDLTGWRLVDIADERPQFAFPPRILGPGETIRVYTNQTHSDSGGFSFGSNSAIWSNSNPDEAGLYDAERVAGVDEELSSRLLGWSPTSSVTRRGNSGIVDGIERTSTPGGAYGRNNAGYR